MQTNLLSNKRLKFSFLLLCIEKQKLIYRWFFCVALYLNQICENLKLISFREYKVLEDLCSYIASLIFISCNISGWQTFRACTHYSIFLQLFLYKWFFYSYLSFKRTTNIIKMVNRS